MSREDATEDVLPRPARLAHHYSPGMTFSIVARSADGESWGVAVASKFLAVGSVVPAAVAEVGAIATQAWANVAYKGQALALLDEGATAAVALQRLLEEDDGREHRQVGLVDAEGGAASHTGSDCLAWAGGRTGDGYAIQGNILTGEEVVAAMEAAWHDVSDPGVTMARRLLAALRAGDEAGGDSRGRQSAAIFVVKDGAGYDGRDDVAVDLRVDDHSDPCAELARLLDLNEWYLTPPDDADKVPLTDELRAELDAFAQGEGKDSFAAWVGAENLEMRVGDDWVDQSIVEHARTKPAAQ
jgi:uncharacterized Ntn-hydrolase superfamily protein